MRKTVLGVFAILAASLGAAEAMTITTGVLECLPNEANTAVTAMVTPEVAGSEEVRLYFRRLHPNGAYYWNEMTPQGDGAYWAVFPKAEKREQQGLNDEWWDILKDRDWVEDRDREWLEDFFDEQDHEAAEFYVGVADANGRVIAKSPTQLVRVLDRDDCEHGITVRQIGAARNMTVGETTALQEGKEVFHWLCDGIVTRVNVDGILRGDETCRGCVIAGWFPVAASAGGIVASTTIEKREPRRASDIQP